MKPKIVSWFSAGVSSAVATKLALAKYPDLEIIYIHIDDQHEDSMRFVKDCESWFGKKITILQNPMGSVDAVVRKHRWINGVGGARCTKELKRRVRQTYEQQNLVKTYIWGMDCTKREQMRADRLRETMPLFEHEFPLIDHNITKEKAHSILAGTGIKRPHMYDLGYPNNNCVACVKGGAGYWNKIRIDFPEMFASRAKLERDIGASCLKGVYLDELDPEAGRELKIIEIEDCGILCELNTYEVK
jgi:hypothetical protein